MALRFKNRGYSDNIISKALSAASSVLRDNLLMDLSRNNHTETASKPFDNVPVFSTPFSSEFHKIRNTVTMYLPIQYNDPAYSAILSRGFKAVSRRVPTLGGGDPSHPVCFLVNQ